MKWSIASDPAASMAMMLVPLGHKNEQAIVADLKASGLGDCCAACSKPFSLARKPRVFRWRTVDDAGILVSTVWLVCGKCRAIALREGPPTSFKAEAFASAASARALAQPARARA